MSHIFHPDETHVANLMRLSEPCDELLSVCMDVTEPGEVMAFVNRSVSAAHMVMHVTDAGYSVTTESMEQARKRWETRLNQVDGERDVRIMSKLGCWLIVRGSSQWPEEFDALGDCRPLGLWARGPGNLSAMASQSVALVGARVPSEYGASTARKIAFECARDGYTVVSGGAYGIDAAAHDGALRGTDGPATVAFMAGGVDSLYPRGNLELLEHVVRSGAVVSEASPGANAMRHRFLARNRLIAALAGATVVVQAGFRSGAINTANHAAELGKPVGAVPGRVTEPESAGCHRLIRSGAAVLVTSTEDVKELAGNLDPVAECYSEQQQTEIKITDDLTDNELRLYSALPTVRGTDLSSLSHKSGLSLPETRAVLGGLMLKGLVVKDSHGWRKADR